MFLSTQAIGTRLSELCHSDSESPANILGYIFDEETKRRMRKEDEEEDYLDDSKSGEWLMAIFGLFSGAFNHISWSSSVDC